MRICSESDASGQDILDIIIMRSPAEMESWRLGVIPRHVTPAQVIHHYGHEVRGRGLDTGAEEDSGGEDPHQHHDDSNRHCVTDSLSSW